MTAPARTMTRSMTTTDEAGDHRLIPRPHVPVRPPLSWTALRAVGGTAHDYPCVLDIGSSAHLTSGRMAIALALALEGLGAGDEILLPSYHCATMVEPARAHGMVPVFYRIGADFACDLEDIAAKRTARTRAVLAASYFGFPQDWEALRAFCDHHRLILIEDCAHSLFGSHHGRPLGSFGDWAVSSLTKFLPCRDGGALTTARRGALLAGLALTGQGLPAEIRAVLAPLSEAVAFRRLPLLRPLLRLNTLMPRRSGSATPAQSRSGAGGEFDLAAMRVRGSRMAAVLARHPPRRRIAEGRRAIWLRLADGFADCPGCRPVRPDMPPGMVPFMFPLWVDELPARFPRFEDLAIPVQRFGQFPWPGMDADTCNHSRLFSRHVLQLPCHQELTEAELDWIIAQVRGICASVRT